MEKENVIGRGRVGRLLQVLWVGLVLPVVAVGFCARYEAVRAAAGYEADDGRVANRAWYQVAREPATAAAKARLIRYAWYSAALVAVAGIVVFGGRAEGRRWTRIRRGALVAMLSIFVAMLVDGRRSEAASVMTRLGMHASLGGLVLTWAAWLAVRRGNEIGVWKWIPGLAVVVGAGVSGLALAGWRASQLEDLLRQPRDLAHLLAGVGIVAMGAAVGTLRRRRVGPWAVAVLLMTGVVVAWTGVLMTVDGSDRTTGVGWLRGSVVQEVGIK